MRAEIAKGAAWMVLFRLFDRSIGIVSTAMLARLLIPADFGLVAMAMSIIAMIELATTFSFDVALIQKPDPKREHYDTAWTLNILIAIGGGLLTAALAYPAAAFYGDARLAPVMFAIAAAWMISGFDNVGTVNFRRNMNFASEFRLLSTKRIVSFVVVIAAAFLLRSYWALVVGMATGRIVGVVLSYLMQPFRPRLSLACTRELFSFSGWLLLNNMATVAIGRIPHFFVGRVFGAQALGAYTVGAEISQLAHTELIAPINRAMFPGYARLAADPPAFRRTCVDATSAILLIVMPVSIGIALLAAPFVRILLGPQWHEAVPVIQILAFAGAAIALTSNTFSAYLALGRSHLPTIILLARLSILVVAGYMLGSRHGMLGVAWAELLSAVGSFLISLPVLFSALKLSLREYLASLWRPLVASCLMGVGLYGLTRVLNNDGSFLAAALELAISAPVGAALYVALIWLLWQMSGRPESIEKQVVSKGREWLAGKLGKTA